MSFVTAAYICSWKWIIFKKIFKNSYYRFMRNVHVNWLHFTTLLSAQIINNHLRSLTSEKRADCFVVDDSYFSRTGFKKTELVAKAFDHVSMTYKKGFRMMTLGWTDGASFMPINSVLLSSQKLQNMIGENKVFWSAHHCWPKTYACPD